MNFPEYELQCQFVELLRLHNILVFSIPNSECRGQTTLKRILNYKRLKKSGNLPGASDLIVVLPNKVIFVEMKSKTGKQSEAQKQFQQEVTELGHEYRVINSWEACEQFVKQIKKNILDN